MAPQHQPIRILLTRPSAQSHRFAAELAARFGAALDPVISPLMSTRMLDVEWPHADYSALILTSETGAAAAGQLRQGGRSLPMRAICVGDRTAASAQSAGFTAESAAGDAEALLARILASNDPGPFLHLRGSDARGDIVPRLVAKGRPAQAAIVYEQIPQDLNSQARSLLQGTTPLVVPVFSPRSADLLARNGPFTAPLWIAAISSAAAARAEQMLPQRLEIAVTPDAPGMLDALSRLIPEPSA
ncbi:MAG: uroporphyrinogen-III synthase [Paracoccaceae bacterium]